VAAVVVSATVWVATTQTHAQARQEQRTFIRTQRQAAYARLFQVDRLLSTDEAGLESTCTLTPAKQAEVQQQLDEIDVAAKNIAMIGSTAAWDAADKLNKAHHSLIGLWQSYCNAVSPSPTGTRQPPPPKPQLMGIRAADKDLEVASQQFLTLARSEIQS
jgi:hypothetical protein